MAYRLFLGSNPPAAGADYVTEVLADSPAGYWRLGEASGNPQDSSGNARHMTVVAGTPTYDVAGAIVSDDDGAVTFDGSTEYFTTPDGAWFDFGDVFTLEAWVKCSASGAMTIVSKGTNSFQLRIVTPGDDGTARALELVRTGVAEIVESTADVPSSGWHHVVATKTGATVKLYIDGSDVTGTVSNSTFTNTADVLVIGATPSPAEFFNGSIDEVAVYLTALSAARVLAHYNAGIAAGGSAQGLTLGLLDAAPALYAPTVIPDQFVTLGLLDASPALYAPTLVGKNTVTLGLLDAGPALHAPTLLTKNTITLGLLDASAALFAPTLAPQPVTITLGSIDASPALYAPNISAAAALPLLDASNALYAPAFSFTLTAPLLDAGPALYAPSVSFAIDAPFIDAANALYAPAFTVGPVTVTLGLLDAASALYAPAFSFTLTVPLLDAGPALYAPDLIPDQFVTLDLLDAGPTLYEPAFSGAGTIVLQLLDSGSELYDPTLSPQPVRITLGLLTSTSALYAPTIAVIGGNQAVTLGLLTSARGLFAPVLSGPDTSLPEYEPIRLYRTPARGTVKLPVLASRASLYAPTLAVDDDDEIFAMLAYA